MHKIEHCRDGDWVDYIHPRVYRYDSDERSGPRWTLGLSREPLTVLTSLLDRLPDPFLFLYVLHTPRGEAAPGRYQSSGMSRADALAFLQRFIAFLAADARHDFWIHSPAADATLVWDRHDLLFVYGASPELSALVERMGYTAGDPKVPVPHAHRYREEFDADAVALHAAVEWLGSPLRPEDEP